MTKDGRSLGYSKGSREMHVRTKLTCTHSPVRVQKVVSYIAGVQGLQQTDDKQEIQAALSPWQQ